MVNGVRRAAFMALVALAACEPTPYRAGDPFITAPDSLALPHESPTVSENSRAGTPGWYLDDFQRAKPSDVAVWASPYSLMRGDTLDVFVHAKQGPVNVYVYRIGWYGGVGGRRVFTQLGVTAGAQPPCTQPLGIPVVCAWTRTLRVPTDTTWTSGVYVVQVIGAAGRGWAYPFVVRNGRVAKFTAVIPQFTWQAYNDFGGASLYTTNWTPYASFERPYAANAGGSYIYNRGYSPDLQGIRWLEKSGYDVTYVSDVDLATAPQFTAPLKGMLFVGHSEYWTTREYDRVEALRDRGTHLAFFAANNAYWNVRLERGSVTGRAAHLVVSYKTEASHERDPLASSPANNTTQFRDESINRPENGLYGVMYVRYVQGTYGLVAPANPKPEARAFLAAAGLAPNDSIPAFIGPTTEGDQIVTNGRTPSGIQVILTMPYPPNTIYDTRAGALHVPGGAFQTTFFRAPSGAGVFAGGINEWGTALDDFGGHAEPHVQLITKAVLDWMLAH